MTAPENPDKPLTYETPAEAAPTPTDEVTDEVEPGPTLDDTPEEATPASPTG